MTEQHAERRLITPRLVGSCGLVARSRPRFSSAVSFELGGKEEFIAALRRLPQLDLQLATPPVASSRGTASAGRNEPLVSASYPSSPSLGTCSSPVSSGLRTGHPSTLPAWSFLGLVSTPGRLAHTQVRGLFGLSRTSGAVARGLPFPGPFRRAAPSPVADAECTLRLIPLVCSPASHKPGPLGDAFLVQR
ncbi:hypothetical protein T02_14133 [Trichinella nativa]|uniref:Uncharacterized protein n=1 Tax=Trichinella nativa TaxID=6335 RepID=A0A0V1L2Q7_9BILA|nr:hypothetical protein T02_14133 [Trichinella nativa]